jgi:hypothetical protein
MKRKLKVEDAIYLVILMVALIVRLVDLTVVPLTDLEAGAALRALDLAQGHVALVGTQPLYVLLTSVLFRLTSASELMARLVPAIFGSLLIILPYAARKYIGWLPGILLAIIIALDPGMVAVSRQAGSVPIAVTGLLLAAAFYLNRHMRLAGLFASFALLAGTDLWIGAFALLISVLWYKWSERRRQVGAIPLVQDRRDWWGFAVFLAGGLLVFGTLFVTVPAGVAGIGDGLIAYFSGWLSGEWASLLDKLRVLLFYEPFLVVFTLIGLLIGLKERVTIDRWSFRWFAVTARLVLLYPGGNSGDVIWLLLPMAVISARKIASIITDSHDQIGAVLGQALMILVLIIFGWLNLSAIPVVQNQQAISIRTIGLVGAVILILLITILVMWGWSTRVALNGLLVGVVSALILFSVSAMVNAAGLGRNPSAELWQMDGYFAEQDLLVDTIGDTSEQVLGTRDGIDIVVQGVESPSLRWSLREFRNVDYVSELMLQGDPSVIITPDNVELNLPAEYRGQDFTLSQEPAWSLFLPSDWLKWLLTRDALMDRVYIRSWVRLDLFPGAD